MGLETETKKDICLWKEIANHDNSKREEGREDITLDENSICYTCDGFNMQCSRYHESYNSVAD